MSIKIKNWQLALLSLLFFSFFLGLGYWQLSRAREKTALLAAFNARMKAAPLTLSQINTKKDSRFYQAELLGTFDNEHTFLLDNKTFHGKVGYEVYTPFKAEGSTSLFLIDRGFIPLQRSRAYIPPIKPILGKTRVSGFLNFPPTYVALGQMRESNNLNWPLRIEYINLKEITSVLNRDFSPYILVLKPEEAGAYAIEWQILTMSPERHRGYAVQWFALALTLLILFVALNRGPIKKTELSHLSL